MSDSIIPSSTTIDATVSRGHKYGAFVTFSGADKPVFVRGAQGTKGDTIAVTVQQRPAGLLVTLPKTVSATVEPVLATVEAVTDDSPMGSACDASSGSPGDDAKVEPSGLYLGRQFEGRVTRLVYPRAAKGARKGEPYGALVSMSAVTELPAGREALLHITELTGPRDQRPAKLRSLVGTEVAVSILTVESKAPGQLPAIRLSMDLRHRQERAAQCQPGQVVEGQVVHGSTDWLLLELGDDFTALLYFKEVAGSNKVARRARIASLANCESLTATVLKSDSATGKVELTLKPQELQSLKARSDAGEEFEGTVVGATRSGLFIDIEGFVGRASIRHLPGSRFFKQCRERHEARTASGKPQGPAQVLHSIRIASIDESGRLTLTFKKNA